MAPTAFPHAAGSNGAVVKQIKVELTRKEMTADDLARIIEMHPTQLSRYLTFKREMKVNQIDKIIDALGIARSEFYRRALSERVEE